MALAKWLILMPTYLLIIFLVGYSLLNLFFARERFSRLETLTLSPILSYLFMPILITIFALIGFSFNISLAISILLPILLYLLFRKRRAIKYQSKFNLFESLKRNKVYYLILIFLFIFQIALTSFAVLNWQVKTENEHIFKYTTFDYFAYIRGSHEVKRSIPLLERVFPLRYSSYPFGHLINWAVISTLTRSAVLNAGKIFQIVISSLIFLTMLILAKQIFKKKESVILVVLLAVILAQGLGGIFALYSYLIHNKSDLFNVESMKAHMSLFFDYSNYERFGSGYMETELLKFLHLPNIKLPHYEGHWRNIQYYTIGQPTSPSTTGILMVIATLHFFIRGLKRKKFQVFAIFTALTTLFFQPYYSVPVLCSLISFYFISPIIKRKRISWSILFIVVATSLILLVYRSVVASDTPLRLFTPRLITNPVILILYYGLSLPLAVLAYFKARFEGKNFFIWFILASILLVNTLGIPAIVLPKLLISSLTAFGILSAAYVASIKSIKIKAWLICLLVLFGLVGPISAALVNRYTNRMQRIGIEEVKAGEWIRENTEKYALFIVNPYNSGEFIFNVPVGIFGERRFLLGGVEPGEITGSSPLKDLEADIMSIFTSDNYRVVRTLLDKYKVSYIYYGPHEREDYGEKAEMFEKYLETVYSSKKVKIFKVKRALPIFYEAF
jgi:hypothetical protein